MRWAASERTKGLLEAVVLAGLFFLLFVYTFRPNWDIDIFWHIRTGEWIVRNAAIPHTDIFSATDPSRAWTPFQWLYEVLVYEVEAYLGMTAVRQVHAAAFLVAFGLLYVAYRRGLPGRSPALLLLVATIVLSEDRLRVRPEAFNFLFTAALLPVLVAPRVRWQGLVVLAVTASLWANLHAGGALWLALAGLAVAGGRVVARIAGRTDEADGPEGIGGVRGGLAVAAAAILPMLPMPGFVRGAWTALAMYQGSADLIPEWSAPVVYLLGGEVGPLSARNLFCGLVPYLVLALVAIVPVAGILRRGLRDFARTADLSLAALALLCAALAASTARFIYLDGVALLLVALAHRDRVASLFDGTGRRLVATGVAALLAGVSFQYSIVQQRGGLARAVTLLEDDLEPGAFPVRASDAIAGMGLTGRIFNASPWGGYFVYRHFPECTVFSDGRGNFTPAEHDVLVATHRPLDRDAALEAAWQQFPFEIVVFPPPVFPLHAWDSDRWILAWRDDTAEVFLRRSPGNAPNIERMLAWWARMGVDSSGGPDAFQAQLRRVLSFEYLARKDVLERLSAAAADAQSGDPRRRAQGFYSGATELFQSGRPAAAAHFYEQALAQGFRHDTAALHLAWSLWLSGNGDGARQAIERYFLAPDVRTQRDRGPLKAAGRRILGLLADRLGLAL